MIRQVVNAMVGTPMGTSMKPPSLLSAASWADRTEKEAAGPAMKEDYMVVSASSAPENKGRDALRGAIHMMKQHLLGNGKPSKKKVGKAKKGKKGQGKSMIPSQVSVAGAVPMYVTASFDQKAAVNTAYSTVQALSMLDNTVWKNALSITDLFDQVRLESLDIWLVPYALGAFAAQNAIGAFAVSPSDSPFTEVSQSASVQHSVGPIAMSTDVRRTTVTGCIKLHVKLEKGIYAPSTGSPAVWGDWVGTDQVTTIFANVIPYIEAGGGTSQLGFRYIVRGNLLGRLRT